MRKVVDVSTWTESQAPFSAEDEAEIAAERNQRQQEAAAREAGKAEALRQAREAARNAGLTDAQIDAVVDLAALVIRQGLE